MKIFIRIIIAILIIIAIPLVLALFIKNEYHIEREITINRPKQAVFDYVKHLKNQDYYSVWVMTDPHMKKTFKGTDGTPGFIYGWNGNKKAGEGEQEITKLTEGEKVAIEVRFIRPFKDIVNTPITTTAISPETTRVKWESIGISKYPLNFMNLFMDKMLGDDMHKSLVLLKDILEKQ